MFPAFANVIYAMTENTPGYSGPRGIRMPYLEASNSDQQRGKIISTAAMFLLGGGEGRIFSTGQDFKRVIQTADGPLNITAKIEVVGDTIKLNTFSVVPEAGMAAATNPGPAILKAAFDGIKAELAQAGFSTAEVTALKIRGTPRVIKLTIDLK